MMQSWFSGAFQRDNQLFVHNREQGLSFYALLFSAHA
jgi:hypothetical protein